MHEFFASFRAACRDGIQRARLGRLAFILTAAYGGTLFWLAPHPPMADLPQHAGQISLLRDLVLEQSQWFPLLRINYVTPYWIGYGLALPLSLLMPVAIVLKLMLTLAYYAFVFGCVLLRRHFHGDNRLDWMFIPGFFGIGYAWGLFTFLVAAPLGLMFVYIANRYAEQADTSRGVRLAAFGLILFFSHGLVFLFACSIGITLLAMRCKHPYRNLSALLPYALLGVVGIAYALTSNYQEATISAYFPAGVEWKWNWLRLGFLNHIFGIYEKSDLIFSAAGIGMLIAPKLLSCTLNTRMPAAFAPILMLSLIWLMIPHYAMKTTFLYERFAIFILPFYSLIFSSQSASIAQSRQRIIWSGIGQLLLAAICWAFLLVKTENILRFSRESEAFNIVRAAAEPGQRALAIIIDKRSEAAKNPWAYLSYPLWYQAENGGLVDFNFAWYPPQIVRFRNNHLPQVRPGWEFQSFNWDRHHGWEYRYFFVRHTKPIPNLLFENDKCRVVLTKSSDHWSLYERRECNNLQSEHASH